MLFRSQDPHLGKWVSNQRKNFKHRSMSAERKRLLDSIGFVWEVHSSNWTEMYKRLIDYKNFHGTTNVKVRDEEDPQLGMWVSNQRRDFKNKKILSEREGLLNSIGFDWDVNAGSQNNNLSAAISAGSGPRSVDAVDTVAAGTRSAVKLKKTATGSVQLLQP